MYTIEVDFDVYKQLTVRRTTENVSYNDVIRELLGMPGEVILALKAPGPSPQDWLTKGVVFPVGTEFKANYKGLIYTARVEGGALVYNGKSYGSPSAAAMSVTGSAVNGWRFWECRLPGKSDWQLIEMIRHGKSS